MFVDLVGSTALSARLDPGDMREVLRAYQDAVAGEVLRWDGHIAKFMGDGVLAYFGWPRAHEDDAERAVRAGLEVLRTVRGLVAPSDQGAKLWELRAATSLARLWQGQDRCQAACGLLAPVYGWFSEGFAMPDLREARELLEALR